MSLLLETETASVGSRVTPAQRIRASMAAVALQFTWFGVRKSLNNEQKSRAADAFGAEGAFLSAGKKLLDTRHEAYQAVTAIRTQITQFWRSLTLPFPEPGVRLIRRDDLELLDTQLTALRTQLYEAVEHLDAHFGDLKAAARQRLGRLYNAADYPGSLLGLFQVEWTFPNIEAPGYLHQIHPGLYEEESRRVAARFDEAVALAEQAFTEEFGKLVAHLTERLSGGEDGQPKIFRDSAVDNLLEFFQRFRHLNLRSNAELDDLVAQAQRVVRNVQPQTLRDDQSLRQQIATQLVGVQSQVEGLLVDRPRRNILRRSK